MCLEFKNSEALRVDFQDLFLIQELGILHIEDGQKHIPRSVLSIQATFFTLYLGLRVYISSEIHIFDPPPLFLNHFSPKSQPKHQVFFNRVT